MAGDPSAEESLRGEGSRRERGWRIFLSAGEASGDLHGSEVARALHRAEPSLELYGLGGPRMAAAGVRLLADLDTLAVMGVSEVARRLPSLLGVRHRVRGFLVRRSVDLFLPIDYPGLNLHLSAFARRRGLAVLYYIAPQVWAWREGRARRLARHCDLICTVLPFEEELLSRYGARAIFVGHPLLDAAPNEGRQESSPAGDGGSEARVVLSLFPGSREQEVRRILPIFAAAGRRVLEARPSTELLVAAAPGLPEHLYEAAAPARRVSPEQAVRCATAALAKSGTVNLQLALAGVPLVVGYRMAHLSYRVARRLVRVERISLVNLVAGERIVPELIQEQMTPRALCEAVLPLLDENAPQRREMKTGLDRVRARLGDPGCADRVARLTLRLLAGKA
ncbi:MAG: lipid-A-disaccharide synthase [Gemmatimonadota bacterium]